MVDTFEQDHTLHDMYEPCNAQVMALVLEHDRTFHTCVAPRVGGDTVAADLLQQRVQQAVEHPARAREATRLFAWFSRILRSTRADDYRARVAEEHHARWGKTVIAQDRTHLPRPRRAPDCALRLRRRPLGHLATSVRRAAATH